MIITCPSCATRYEIPPDHLGPAGRMVRCTNCGHRWFVAHDATAGEPWDSTDVEGPLQGADDSAVGRASAPPPPLDRAPDLATGDSPAKARREPATTRSTGATLGWLAVLLMLLVLTGLVLGRNEVVALAPQTAPIYQRLGLPVTQAIGLELSGIVSERLGDEAGDVLRITGTVRNVAGMERAVPALRIALLDAGREEVLVREVEVPQAVLADGASTRFSIDLDDPPTVARNFSITFAVEE
jgi:predicted Zn finger-like uncharacterized protein